MTKTTPVIECQKRHVTIRSFKNLDISKEMLSEILEGGRRAPTSSNMQAYSIVIVKDPKIKAELAVHAGNQKHVETCPVFVAFCADLNRLQATCASHGAKMTNNLETFLISSIDASLVGMSVQTAAESFGLGAVMIGAMRNHPQEVASLLNLPPQVYVVYGMCLGWPVEEDVPPQKPRLPIELVIHNEKYDHGDPMPAIKRHNMEMAEHYSSLGKNLDVDAWSGVIARNLSRPLRPTLKANLENMGFNFAPGE